jgi:UDP-N-acetylmuramate: L-alanyl-gamma-D-glutamyl-meso-diaminopimelate ligase
MELRAEVGGVTVYDDFAHHPTAIATTLAGLRARMAGAGRILAVLEPRSNTMRMGVHQDSLRDSLGGADRVFLYRPGDLGWDLDGVVEGMEGLAGVDATVDDLLARLLAEARPGDSVLIMSNGGFGGLHQRFIDALATDPVSA